MGWMEEFLGKIIEDFKEDFKETAELTKDVLKEEFYHVKNTIGFQNWKEMFNITVLSFEFKEKKGFTEIEIIFKNESGREISYIEFNIIKVASNGNIIYSELISSSEMLIDGQIDVITKRVNSKDVETDDEDSYWSYRVNEVSYI